MSTRTRRLAVPPEAVWAVLADGWSYPAVIVGCVRMRAVDDAWPAAGSRLHHGVGAWPLVLQDTTSSTLARAPHRLEMTARGWPLGEARVVLDVAADAGGSRVRITERATSGPGGLLRPLVAVVVWLRNGETLRRLAQQAEGRHGARGGRAAGTGGSPATG